MVRATYGLAVLLCLVPMVTASPSRRQDGDSKIVTAPVKVSAKPLAASSGAGKFQMIDTTEIFLDGKACKYAQVPGDATIVELEVAADKKTILKIHFRSMK